MEKHRGKISILVVIIIIISFGIYDKLSLPTNNIEKVNSSIEGMEVHYIDVDQGDATLLIDNDKVLLIDGGDDSEEDVIISYLSNLGIEEIDYIIATHAHSDHVGGLDSVINNFEVENIIMNDSISTSKSYEDLLDAIAMNNINLIEPNVYDKFELDKAYFTILGPEKEYGDLNNDSIITMVEYNDSKFLFTGDAESEAEYDLINTDYDLSTNVLQVGHHGSDTSTTDDFLEATSPQIAIISCGKDNQYGHPADETIEKLSEKNILTYRTDFNGNIVIATNGENMEVFTEY